MIKVLPRGWKLKFWLKSKGKQNCIIRQSHSQKLHPVKIAFYPHFLNVLHQYSSYCLILYPSLCFWNHRYPPFRLWQLQSDHRLQRGAYSNAIKPPPPGNQSRRGLSSGQTQKRPIRKKRSQTQPEEVRGLFTEQQSLIGCMLPRGVSTANR